jgi:V/A-type H+-transporting ATPase subunit A
LEIVKLIGSDILPEDQKLIIETARIIRLGFLQQNSYHETDTYVPIEKQLKMMDVILHFYDKARLLVEKSIPLSLLRATGIYESLIKIKYDVPNDNINKINEYYEQIDRAVGEVISRNL